MTYIACIAHITRILKLFVEAYKKIFFIHFYSFLIHFIHLELTKKHIEKLQKEACNRYQNLSEEEKDKRRTKLVKDIKRKRKKE